MKEKTRRIIEEAVNDWAKAITDNLSDAALESFVAGERHASGFSTGMGVSFEVLEKDAMDYMTSYREKLLKDGTISITTPKFDVDGKYAGFDVDDNYPWLKDKPAETRNEIADIIERGIREGKPTGIRVGANGKYPEGSIADELNSYFNNKKSEASTVARSETARCYYNGEMKRYSDSGVEYVEFMGGPNACEICDELNGKIYKLGSEPQIPIHPNCRCDYRPYFPETPAEAASLDSLKDDAYLDEDIDADIDVPDYEELAPKEVSNPIQRKVTAPIISELEAQKVIRTYSGAINSASKKDIQKLYNNDPKFRELADTITLYSEGEFSKIRAAAKGEAMFEGRSIKDVLGWGKYKPVLKGQKLEESTGDFHNGVKSLMQAIDEAPVRTEKVYRGAYRQLVWDNSVTDEIVYKWKTPLPEIGDELDLSIASFTTDANTAMRFANGLEAGRKGFITNQYAAVIYELEDAKALDISALSPWKQKEVLTHGKFVVSDVKTEEVLLSDKGITLNPAIRNQKTTVVTVTLKPMP